MKNFSYQTIQSPFIQKPIFKKNRETYEPDMFPIDSLKENMFLYFWYTAGAHAVLSITAEPMHSTTGSDNEHVPLQLKLQCSCCKQCFTQLPL